MITEYCRQRSLLHELTGGGSYPDGAGGIASPTINGGRPSGVTSARDDRQAKKTPAISLQVNYLLSFFPREPGQTKPTAFSGDGAGTAEEIRIPKWKRGLDLTCILLSAPVWLVAMVLITLWIKLTSPGPVFYRQTRVGLGGRPFTIFKFRSMKMNAETATHTQYFGSLIESNASMAKLDSLGDSRVIPGGCCLRASGLDELPQLLNVLRGEMSLVGPRPCLPAEFERYEDWHKGRVYAPPGLTGYWQVNGKNKTSFKQMIELDLLYANRMSLGLDLAVMLATIPALLMQFIESRNRCIKAYRRHEDRVPAPRMEPLARTSDPMGVPAKAA